jgi:hypothetical protein
VFHETVLQSVAAMRLGRVARPAAAILLFGTTPRLALPIEPV